MSGFDPGWLALREPVDHGAINHGVRQRLLRHLDGHDPVRIVDLGCGTGSNLRGLAPDISKRQQWLLVDHDTALLDHARAALTDTDLPVDVACRQADLASGRIGELVQSGTHLVTAAAFFDLVSTNVIQTMAAEIAGARVAFYTTLTYDGIAGWLPEAPLNRTMREAFNRHQQSDKGFGPAAGPEATRALASAFEHHGYRVFLGPSPWVLDRSCAALRRATDAGWAQAVAETGAADRAEITRWLQTRHGDDEAITIVGHQDLLALPPD